MVESEQKNKYYTPSIEEFRVGFEFEDSYDNGENFAENHIDELNFKDVVDTLLYLHSNDFKIRVKYLDKEDIESLGFSLDYYSDKEDRSLFRNGNDLTLSYGWKDKMLWITHRDLINYGQFKGTIKNKSELKVLLKQLGIDE